MLCGPDGRACCQLEFLKTADENGEKENTQVSESRNYHLHAHNKNSYIYVYNNILRICNLSMETQSYFKKKELEVQLKT
jgi:hypothetical protein